MKLLTALALTLLPTMSLAQQYSTEQLEDGSIGINVFNDYNIGVPEYTDIVIETPHGTVVLRYTYTNNGPKGCCADEVEVLEVPDGYVVIPGFGLVEEKQSSQFKLMKYIGG